MIRRLARCIREYKWAALLSPLCMVGEVAMEVLIPLVMADLYDYGIKMQDMQVVAAKSGILVLCALASLSFGVLSAAFASKAGTGFAKNLRHDMYHQVQDFSFSNIDKFSTASIVTRLTSDVATLQNTFQMMIRMAIRCPMMLILALILAQLLNSVRPSLVYCVALPILICALLCLIPKVFRIFDRVFRTYDKMNNVVQENVHGIRVVKSFVREDRETEKFTSVSGTIYKDFCKAERIMSLANPIMQLCVYGCMLAISWIGAHLVIASGNNPDLGLTTGQLSSMFTYTSQILSSLMMLSTVAVMLTMSRAPLKRCYEILTEEPNLTSPTENAVMEVPDGSIITLVGANGAGKSTTLRSIVGLVKARSGSITLDGEELLGQATTDIVSKGITLVPEGRHVFPDMTVLENLKIGAYLRKDKLSDDIERVYNLFPRLKERSWQAAGTLSGGEQQMLAVGRALMSKPKIIMMDEPSLGLAPIIVQGIFDIIQQINKEGTTVLLIEQNANMALKVADYGYVMETGRISLAGTGAELLANEQVKELYLGKSKQ